MHHRDYKRKDRVHFPIQTVTPQLFDADVYGNQSAEANNVSNIENSGEDCLTFCTLNLSAAIETTHAAIILAPESAKENVGKVVANSVVWVQNPMLEFIRVLLRNDYSNELETCEINDGGAFISEKAEVNESTEVFPFAAIHSKCVIGPGCRIQNSATIGAVGLAYADDNDKYLGFPHLGGVIIEDNVHIGASTVVVKGILQDTVIRSGAKIGNQVNIGHNVMIGENCFISAGAVLCGSVKLQERVWIAPGAVLLNGITVGAGARVGLGAVLNKNAKPGYLYLGNPARPVSKV